MSAFPDVTRTAAPSFALQFKTLRFFKAGPDPEISIAELDEFRIVNPSRTELMSSPLAKRTIGPAEPCTSINVWAFPFCDRMYTAFPE